MILSDESTLLPPINVSKRRFNLSSNASKLVFLFKSESNNPADNSVKIIQTVPLKKSLTAN